MSRIGNPHIPCCDQVTRLPKTGPYHRALQCPVCNKPWVVTVTLSVEMSMRNGRDIWKIRWYPAEQWESLQAHPSNMASDDESPTADERPDLRVCK